MARQRKSSTEQPANYAAPAAEKALDILEALAAEREGATSAEVCRLLNRSMGEVYRVLLVLERRQYIVKAPDTERYHLTLRLFDLAHRHPRTAQLIRLAGPTMERLAASTQQSCHLAVADSASLVVLATADSPTPMGYGVKVGATFPLLETSSGVAIVAFSRAYTSRSEIADNEGNSTVDYADRLARVRKLGYEVWDSQVVHGVTNITVPVFDHSGHACAALTIPYLEQTRLTTTRKQALDQLIDAAGALSHELGHSADKQDFTPRPEVAK